MMVADRVAIATLTLRTWQVRKFEQRGQTDMHCGVRYYLVLHDVDPDNGETQEISRGPSAWEVGKRLGLGAPSDPEGLGIWYVEGAPEPRPFHALVPPGVRPE